MVKQEKLDRIEALIDDLGLTDFLDAVADICLEKANHLQTNWGDAEAALDWCTAGYKINSLAAKREISNCG